MSKHVSCSKKTDLPVNTKKKQRDIVEDAENLIKEHKCQVCGVKTQEPGIIIRDPSLVSGLKVCGDCCNDYSNEDWDKLSKKLRRKEK